MLEAICLLLTLALMALAVGLLRRATAGRRARWAEGRAQTVKEVKEWARLLHFRSFRRRLHVATVLKAINGHPQTRLLARAVRRQAARNAGHHAYRQERGLPEIYSRAELRRQRRGFIHPNLILSGGSSAPATRGAA